MKMRIRNGKQPPANATPGRAGGFTLVELMIAMVLGLVIIGGVISVFLATKQSYRTNEALSQVQDHGRTAFEFLARDIRMAGLSGCGNAGRIANVLNNGPNAGGTNAWWADFDNTVRGYNENDPDPSVTTGTGEGERVANTDSVQLVGVAGGTYSVQSHSGTTVDILEAQTDLSTGDVAVICDPDHAAVMQISSYDTGNVRFDHDTTGPNPGNCSAGAGFPTSCSTANAYSYGPNAQVSRLAPTAWYVGNNRENGLSLYRISLTKDGSGNLGQQPDEMVRNVTNMQLQYHVVGNPALGNPAFQDADAITNWQAVDAMRIVLTLQSEQDRAGTDQNALTRSLSTTIAIRNRVN